MKERKEEGVSLSRRTMLKGSAVIIAGGIGGGLATAYAAAPKTQAAPPLPWKWVKLDPMEAGRRAFKYYLKEKG